MTALEYNGMGGCPKCGDQSDKDDPNRIRLEDPSDWDEQDVFIPARCDCGRTWTEWYSHGATQYEEQGGTVTVSA